MLHIKKYLRVSNLQEAYSALHEEPGSVILGGCGYLRLGRRKLGTAIDLSRLGLDQIEERDNSLEIGAMVTLRKLETDSLLRDRYTHILRRAVENIVGIQMRNCVTLGGSVAGRYPFSDPITALLALDAKLLFYHHGRVTLADYLEGKGLRDILVKILLPKDDRAAAFISVRRTSTDYAVLNVAVSQGPEGIRVVVGSRPGRAKRVEAAEEYLQHHGLNETTARDAGQIAVENIKLGTNPRGSETYRRIICPVLVQRGLLEVMHAGYNQD